MTTTTRALGKQRRRSLPGSFLISTTIAILAAACGGDGPSPGTGGATNTSTGTGGATTSSSSGAGGAGGATTSSSSGTGGATTSSSSSGTGGATTSSSSTSSGNGGTGGSGGATGTGGTAGAGGKTTGTWAPPPAVVVPPLPPPPDYSNHPVDAQGRPIVSRGPYVNWVVPAAKDAISARELCADLVANCFQPGVRSLDACMMSAPHCTTTQPWTEVTPCCADPCFVAYAAQRTAGVDPMTAYLRILYEGPICMPGVDAMLGGAP